MKTLKIKPKRIASSWYVRIPKQFVEDMKLNEKEFEIKIMQDGIVYKTIEAPYTGMYFHLSNALNEASYEKRKRHVSLARCYEMEEKDRKALEIIEKKDFCFSNFLTEMGSEWAKHYVAMAQKAIANKFKVDMKEYYKKR
jgi:hypothetical protein